MVNPVPFTTALCNFAAKVAGSAFEVGYLAPESAFIRNTCHKNVTLAVPMKQMNLGQLASLRNEHASVIEAKSINREHRRQISERMEDVKWFGRIAFKC